MKALGLAAIVLASACLIGGALLHTRAMRRAGLYNAYMTLQQAHQQFTQDGRVTNPSPAVAEVFRYTNAILIRGTNYNCVLGMRWKPLTSDGSLMAITKEGIAIWCDKSGSARIINFEGSRQSRSSDFRTREDLNK